MPEVSAALIRLEVALLAHTDELEALLKARGAARLAPLMSIDDLVHDTWTDVLRQPDALNWPSSEDVRQAVLEAGQRRVDRALRVQQTLRNGGRGRRGDGPSRETHLRELAAQSNVPKTPSSDAIRIENAKLVRDGMEKLEVRDRRVLQLYFFEGQSPRHISERLNCTESAVRSRLARALKRLAKRIKR